MLLLISGGLIQAAQLFLALSILVFIHEAGHFLAAKLFKMRVNKFYLFFDFLFPLSTVLNFALFKFKKGDTEYGIGWFPLGGYVSIAGMVDETSDGEDMKKPPEPDEYRAKPRWQRFIVLIGGIVMNLLLGWLLFSFILLHYEKKYLPSSEVTEIYPAELGKEIGLLPGDKVLQANQHSYERFSDLFGVNMFFGGTLNIDRNGKKMDVKVPSDFFKKNMKQHLDVYIPMYQDIWADSVIANGHASSAGLLNHDKLIGGAFKNDTNRVAPFRNFYEFKDFLQVAKKDKMAFIHIKREGAEKVFPVNIDTSGRIGVEVAYNDSAYYKYKKYEFLPALLYAAQGAKKTIVVQTLSFGKMFSGQVSTREISGPIGMARMLPKVWDWRNFWGFTALISIVLAFMNLLPIPVLDGGHIVILLIEGIIGRPLSVKTMERIQTVGTVIVFALMIFAFGNDIFKLFGK